MIAPSAGHTPQPFNSRRLWSLWDIMYNFYLAKFDTTMRRLYRLQDQTHSKWKEPTPSGGILSGGMLAPNSLLSEEDKNDIRQLLESIQEIAKEIQLEGALKRLWRPLQTLECFPSYELMHNELKTLNEIIQDDLHDKWFYYYPKDRWELFHGVKDQWGTAYEKFKEIRRDIYNALDCYATGHATACVFHLMRVMEFGVQRFGRRLGVPLTRQTSQRIHDLSWNDILDAINPVIKGMKTDTPARKARHEKIRAIQSYLYAVKDAWRNPTMHPRKKGYKDAEALDIINHVRVFMVGLAGGAE